MKGIILDWDDNLKTGLIRGNDDKKYKFSPADWKTKDVSPKAGHEVDFDVNGGSAENVYRLKASTPASDMIDNAKHISSRTIPLVVKIIISLAILLTISIGISIIIDNIEKSKHEQKYEEYQSILHQGDSYFKEGKFDEALSEYYKADSYGVKAEIRNFGIDVRRYEKAYCKLIQNKASECIELLDTEHLKNNEYILRGKCFEKADNLERASRDADLACNAGDCSLKQDLKKRGKYAEDSLNDYLEKRLKGDR